MFVEDEKLMRIGFDMHACGMVFSSTKAHLSLAGYTVPEICTGVCSRDGLASQTIALF